MLTYFIPLGQQASCASQIKVLSSISSPQFPPPSGFIHGFLQERQKQVPRR